MHAHGKYSWSQGMTSWINLGITLDNEYHLMVKNTGTEDTLEWRNKIILKNDFSFGNPVLIL